MNIAATNASQYGTSVSIDQPERARHYASENNDPINIDDLSKATDNIKAVISFITANMATRNIPLPAHPLEFLDTNDGHYVISFLRAYKTIYMQMKRGKSERDELMRSTTIEKEELMKAKYEYIKFNLVGEAAKQWLSSWARGTIHEHLIDAYS